MRVDSVVTVVGPLAVGVAAAGYAVVAKGLPVVGAIVAGVALWQLATVAVVLWSVATARRA
jgi:hypothetical protein